MKKVLSHPLGPMPWSLSSLDGTLQKTSKDALEKLSPVVDEIPKEFVVIIDGMAMVRIVKGNHKTFKDVAEAIFKTTLIESGSSKRVDVVFDVYRDKSIKNAERQHRGCKEAPRYKNILRNHRIKQWNSFLKSSENKASLVWFLCNE